MLEFIMAKFDPSLNSSRVSLRILDIGLFGVRM